MGLGMNKWSEFLIESIPEPRYIEDENLLDKASNLRNLNFKISFSEVMLLLFPYLCCYVLSRNLSRIIYLCAVS